MDFQGKVIQFIGETSGTSKTGKPWKKKEWVVETFGQFPRKVKVQCFNERSDALNLEPGKDYTLYVDLESREFNGRWYTDVSVYRADEYNGQSQPYGGQQSVQGAYTSPQGNYGQPQQGFGAAPYGNPGNSFPGNDGFAPSVEENDEDLPF